MGMLKKKRDCFSLNYEKSDHESFHKRTSDRCIESLIDINLKNNKTFTKIPLENYKIADERRNSFGACYDYLTYIIDNVDKYYNENNIEHEIIINKETFFQVYITDCHITVIYINNISEKNDKYKFDELSNDAQLKAIFDEIIFWCECRDYDNECPGTFEKAVDKAEGMQTPWFLHEYIYEYCLEEVISTIKINNYLFDTDGNLI